MTVSVVQTKDSAGPLSGSTLSFTSSVSIGNSVVVWIGDYDTTSTVISSSTPTYNSGSVTGAAKLIEVQNSGNANVMYFAVYLLPNVASSGTAVGISTTGGRNDASSHYYIAEVAGLGSSPVSDSATPNPATGTGNAGGTLTSGATGAAAGSPGIAIGGMMQDGVSSGWTSPGGWTTITPISFCGAAYQIISSAGSAYTWNPTGTTAGQWAAGAVIVDAGGAGPPPVQYAYSMRRMP